MVELNKKITDAKSFAKKAEQVSREDADYVLNKGASKIEDLEDDVPGPLESFWERITLLFDMVSDYFAGDYNEAPWGTIAAAIFSLAYFIMPLDAVPDFIPFIGYIDDATVIAFALEMIGDDIEEYKVWKEQL